MITNRSRKVEPSFKLPLRLLLVLPFVVQIFAAVGLTGYLSLRNGRQAVNDLADRLTKEVSDRIDLHLENYLDVPKKVNRQNEALIEQGILDIKNFESVGKHFWKQVPIYGFNYIQFGTINGEYIGAGDYGDGEVKIEEIPLGKPGITFKYDVDAQGNRTRLLEKGEFEPRKEPWYISSRDTQKASWGEIYNWETNPEIMSIPAGYPVFDREGKFIGAMGIDLNLATVSRFLNQLKIGKSGKAFILEPDGLLVATSASEAPYRMVKDKAQRLKAEQSQDQTLRSAAIYLKQEFKDIKSIQADIRTTDINGQPHYIKISPWKDDLGLDWLVVLVIPESDFMAQVNANTRTTILLCLGALILATIVGIYTSRWITRPILRLNQASKAIASGEFNQQVEIPSVNELGFLAVSFNRMTQQLQESFTTIEQTNQKLAKSNEDLEIRVEERTYELFEAKLKADAANRAKSDFLANMSHELRTPLNGILGYAQILARTAHDEKQQHGVDIIYQCGSHLLTLINDVLDLSKIEARKLELQPAPFYLPAFLQSVVEICRIKAEQKGIEFIYQAPENLPTGIIADEKRLRQVLINLLGNAIKFTEKGRVTFGVKAVLDNTANIRFLIQDTGVGMTTEQLQKIFLPFEQVGEQQRKTEGTGLGLAISQRFIELMGSQIQVESKLGFGSKFFFNIDCNLATDWVQANSSTTEGIITGYAGNRQKVLIVDDRWENRSVIVNLLEALGFEVIEAQDGKEGLEKIANCSPNITISDLAMPVMDGYEMLKQLRQSELKDAIVIVSSASVFDVDRQKSLDAGGDDFLAKPVQADELYAALAKHLQLDWVYTETKAKSSSNADANTDIIIPTISELKPLLEHVETGYFRGIREELDKLAQLDERYQPFIQKIGVLVKSFNIQKIRHFLQESIK